MKKGALGNLPWLAGLLVLAAGCVSATNELPGVAALPRLDRAVLVTGGAFITLAGGAGGTFHVPPAAVDGAPPAPAVAEEGIPFAAILDVLRRGEVFQRVVADEDPAHRRQVQAMLATSAPDPRLGEFLQQARADGFDLLLVIEELKDGPIESQGTNGRWPVTFATWILLGVGALIPDRTFESRATLSVSLRELQTGGIVHDLELVPGPTELALIERTDVWGLLISIIVPPFWVGDDQQAVLEAVRYTTQRRLLLSMARDLKGEVVRRRLGDRAAADIRLQASPTGSRVVVESSESLSGVRLVATRFAADDVERFERLLLASRTREGSRFHYQADLPPQNGDGLVQVLVSTLGGGVASATFGMGSAR